MTDTRKDFIGIFPNVASKEYCEKIIEHFNWANKSPKWSGENPYGNGNASKIIIDSLF